MPHTILSHISAQHPTIENYVLIRELKLFLALGQEAPPEVNVRIWQSRVAVGLPYSYELSHYVHTPMQADPYIPGYKFYQSELDAIDAALMALTTHITEAISRGLKTTPTNNWVVLNPRYF